MATIREETVHMNSVSKKGTHTYTGKVKEDAAYTDTAWTVLCVYKEPFRADYVLVPLKSLSVKMC